MPFGPGGLYVEKLFITQLILSPVITNLISSHDWLFGVAEQITFTFAFLIPHHTLWSAFSNPSSHSPLYGIEKADCSLGIPTYWSPPVVNGNCGILKTQEFDELVLIHKDLWQPYVNHRSPGKLVVWVWPRALHFHKSRFGGTEKLPEELVLALDQSLKLSPSEFFSSKPIDMKFEVGVEDGIRNTIYIVPMTWQPPLRGEHFLFEITSEID